MKLNGPGKYDDLATIVREKADADSVMVIVLNGNKGHGFSVQTVDLKLIGMLPKLLRDTAEQMEGDMQ